MQIETRREAHKKRKQIKSIYSRRSNKKTLADECFIPPMNKTFSLDNKRRSEWIIKGLKRTGEKGEKGIFIKLKLIPNKKSLQDEREEKEANAQRTEIN